MNIKEALAKGIEVLKKANIEAPVIEAGVILCYAIKRNRAFIYTHAEYVLKDFEQEIYLHGIEKRSSGMPVQYITGYVEFMSIDFNVTSDVLIPRHDTEILVETVIGLASGKKTEILDIGTGSGCIAVSLAHYLRDTSVTAVDISESALRVAAGNAFANHVTDRVTFIRSNLFDNLKGKMFDFIVSNPPYIPEFEISGLQREVQNFEPHLALCGGTDGLDYYRAITREAPAFLKPGGFLVFETGYNQVKHVKDIMAGQGFAEIKITKDIAGIDRVVVANNWASL